MSITNVDIEIFKKQNRVNIPDEKIEYLIECYESVPIFNQNEKELVFLLRELLEFRKNRRA